MPEIANNIIMDKSIWSEFNQKANYESLDRDIKCEVLVVGGGLAGVLTAHRLHASGKSVVLVEADSIGSGITRNTTAVITAQHDTCYADLIEMHGFDIAKAYLRANLKAVEEYKKLCENIDCDFNIKPSYMYSLSNDLSYECTALKSLGYDAELTRHTGLPFEVKSAVKFPEMAEFHPLKFLYALANDLNIYEHTKIIDIDGHTAFTEKYKINFRQAVVATHFPIIDKIGWFFVKMHQERSYVIALENCIDIQGTYIDDQDGGFYWRNYADMLLIGKGEHRTGTQTEAINELLAYANKNFPNAKIKCMWANQDCVSLDNIPYIGRYGKLKDVYTLTGFNLWGMTGSMVGANIITDILNGRDNEDAFAFKTSRRILRTKLFENLGVSILNMIKPTTKRCPHLGCALVYNKKEHSWDCQCHGSRFEKDGKLINNPAINDAKINK